MRRRPLLRAIHRGLGFGLALPLVLLGFTGSLLVFHRELDHFVLNRDLWRVEQSAPDLTLAELAIRLKAQRPAGHGFGADRSSFLGSAPSGYYERIGPDGETRLVVAALDPATGVVRGEYDWGQLPVNRRNLMSVIYRLHYELLAGPAGATLVGFVGIGSLIMFGLGVYLWWPRDGRLRRALSIKRGAPPVRRQFDLHGTLGATGALALIIVAFSGAYMAFPQQFHSAIGVFARVTPFAKAPYVASRSQLILPTEVETRVRNELPDARYDSFGLGDAKAAHSLTFREAGDPRSDYGSSRVFADPATGAILSSRRLRDFTAADIFLRYQFALHNGAALGLPGRILMMLAGLLPLALGLTGIRLWWLRRRARRGRGRSSRRRVLNWTSGANALNHNVPL